MLPHFRCLIVSAMAMLAPMAAEAVPITYNFAGQLAQPVNGASQFSGSFTMDSNPNFIPLPAVLPGTLTETSSDVSMTLHLGSQTYDFSNTPGQSGAALYVNSPLQGYSYPSGSPQESISLNGALFTGSAGSAPSFTINFQQAGGFFSTTDLGKLSTSSFSSGVHFSAMSGGQSTTSNGTLTSIEQVSAPEPCSLAIFGGLAIAAMITARRRVACRTGADGRREGPRASRG